ncbi:MAG: T9SS type A sorting domain-containing protein, partial [Bacteroidota bacterium]
STTVQFSVGTYGHTSLRVFDVLGREVATLVNERRHPGSYSVAWDASNLSSGVYIATLASGGHRASRKLLLTR